MIQGDWSVFNQSDYAKCNKEMRPLACQLAQELDLQSYQPANDGNNKLIKLPSFDIVYLTP